MKTLLYLLLEFPQWASARHWSYGESFGLADGFAAHGLKVTVVPFFGRMSTDFYNRWTRNLEKYVGESTFDAVILNLVHTEVTPALAKLLHRISRRVIGHVCESLSHSSEVLESNPELAGRKDFVYSQLQHCSHALLVDEQDAREVTSEMGIPAFWAPCSVPAWSVRAFEHNSAQRAVFIGSIYGKEREMLLNDDNVSFLLSRIETSESTTPLPSTFNNLQQSLVSANESSDRFKKILDWYRPAACKVRRQLFQLLLDDYRRGFASVNLPSIYQGFPGRVFESIAAGVPCISWDIPERPRTMDLFRPESELPTFDRKQPAELAQILRRLKGDVDFRKQLVQASQTKLLSAHTCEHRAAQVAGWLDRTM